MADANAPAPNANSSNAQADIGPGQSAQVLTEGLMSLFGPAVQAAENGAIALQRSQQELNAELDAVTLGVVLRVLGTC